MIHYEKKKKNTTEQRILTTKKNNSILFKYSKDVTKKKITKTNRLVVI